MAKLGAIIALGILEAGGRNLVVNLASKYLFYLKISIKKLNQINKVKEFLD